MPPRPIPAPEPPPPLRVEGWPLPPYRYVPGLHPHPFRHPGGHMFTGGAAPTEAPWDPATPWEQDRRYLRALDLFDHRYPWEAHEALEVLWRSAPRAEPLSELLQGLIQLSAALLKRHLGQELPAERLLEAAERRLLGVTAVRGERWRGVAIGALLKAARRFDGRDGWPRVDDPEGPDRT